jgi:hypothetical protein
MPVLTQSKVIVKPTCVPNSIIEPWRPLNFSKLFFSIDNLLLGKGIIGIAVHASIHTGVELALLDLFGDFDVVHVLLFGELFFEDELWGGVGVLWMGEGGVLGCGVVQGLEFVVELGLLFGVVLGSAMGD